HNCEFFQNAKYGIHMYSQSGFGGVPPYSIVNEVYQNKIHDNGVMASPNVLFAGDDSKFHDNEIWAAPLGDNCWIGWTGTHSSEFFNKSVHDSAGVGVTVNPGDPGYVYALSVHNNYWWNNAGGNFADYGQATIVYDNTDGPPPVGGPPTPPTGVTATTIPPPVPPGTNGTPPPTNGGTDGGGTPPPTDTGSGSGLVLAAIVAGLILLPKV